MAKKIDNKLVEALARKVKRTSGSSALAKELANACLGIKSKAAPTKKAAPKKKAVAKKAVAKKTTARKAVVKKAAPKKRTAARKTKK